MHILRRLIVTTVVLGSAAALPATAGAAPSRDKQAEAAALQDQIENSDLQISALAEQLNEATARRDAAQLSVSKAEARIAEAKQEVQRILELVRANAVSLYRQHSSGSSAFNSTGKPSDLVSRDEYAAAQAERDNELLDQLKVAQQDLHLRRSDAERARDAAAFQSDVINSSKTAIEAARAQQQALLNQVRGEIAAEVAAERARRDAAARAAFPGPDVGPPNGSAAQAIAYARAVIGAGYSTNPRTGPTYDCSGLTWSAWHAAGVNIPNSSGGQYSGLPKIPLAAAQPGDLIFWGPNGSSHVGLYVGGGRIIDASSGQGQVVERSIWGDPEPFAARVV
jgi:cell wall-associated NlpC family hydrolase